MTLVVRRVQPVAEREELLRILHANLPLLVHDKRFNWLYCENPSGPAQSWFLCDKQSKKAVGMASVFPRELWVGGRTELCGQVGDFAIEAGYRSLGPAIQLQRATFEPVDENRLALCYDCPPHEAGMSTFRRLGMRPNSTVRRFARPLRLDGRIDRVLGQGAWTEPVRAVANSVLRWKDVRRGTTEEVEVVMHEGPFGDEFTELDARIACHAIRGRRSAADLNWRFGSNPLTQHRVIVARLRSMLAGFAVIASSGRVATLVDLFGEPNVLEELVHAAVEECIRLKVETVQAFITDESEFARAIRGAYFHLRSDAARIVAYAKVRGGVSWALEDHPCWSFSQSELMA